MPQPDQPTADQPPASEPALRVFAMPKDANANGDVFGGWVMAQMDLAGAVPAVERAGGRIATVAVNAMRFHQPISIGDLVTCYATVASTGTTSISVKVETWAKRRLTAHQIKVTEGMFVYVAIDENGVKRALPPGE
ncbi:MAG: acyl-CoA thioesterase [Alphaproteobacteria bacterium]|jgi:acyl-CoA thioesterase YciA|nr:acyl-CoA thioesterase [Alphaproteobacteria bacterium]